MTASWYVALLISALSSTNVSALIFPSGSGNHSAFLQTLEVDLQSLRNKTTAQFFRGDLLPEILKSDVVRHYKRRGGGYKPYSPLYEKAVAPPGLSRYWYLKLFAWEGSLILFIAAVVAFTIYRNQCKQDRLRACRYKETEQEEHEASEPAGHEDPDGDGVEDGSNEGAGQRASITMRMKRTETGMESPREGQLDDYFKMRPEELADTMGLSGMALLSIGGSAGVSGLDYHTFLPLCAIQAWVLQGTILFYMARRIMRLSGEAPDDEEKDVPGFIVFAAIYLHFINCINDLPYSLSLVGYVRDLHPKMFDFAIALPVFVMDGFVIPFTSLSVGALYLCTSLSVSDVILNSCAVAFIGNIDNWILSLNEKLNQSANEDGAGDLSVCVPVNKRLMKNMSWWLCAFPVVPTVFSGFFCWIGLTYMQL